MRDHDEVLGRLALGLAAIAELSRHPRRKMPSNGLPAGYTLSTRFHHFLLFILNLLIRIALAPSIKGRA